MAIAYVRLSGENIGEGLDLIYDHITKNPRIPYLARLVGTYDFAVVFNERDNHSLYKELKKFVDNPKETMLQ